MHMPGPAPSPQDLRNPVYGPGVPAPLGLSENGITCGHGAPPRAAGLCFISSSLGVSN